MSKIPEIKTDKGDVIGVGVDGRRKYNWKKYSHRRRCCNSSSANEARGLGLNLLKPNYFDEYKSTDQDFEDWKEGFSFKLSSIKEHYEFRRSVVDQIKMKIENHHQLLLVGEMGTSKSTILMEIICEYFEKGFKILYNFGDSDITNGTEIIHFIENLLNNNNNVLVAVDDVHSERTANFLRYGWAVKL